MQLSFFKIPLADIDLAQEHLNRFLRSHRILHTEKVFSSDNGGYWTVAVEFMEGEPLQESPQAYRSKKEKVDYSKELNEEQFERYEKYRKIRAEIARTTGVSHYLIFNNAELAEMARLPSLTMETIKELKNVNEKRLEDFAKFFINYDNNEKSGKLDGEDGQYGEPQRGFSQGSEGKEPQESGQRIPKQSQREPYEVEKPTSQRTNTNDPLSIFQN